MAVGETKAAGIQRLFDAHPAPVIVEKEPIVRTVFTVQEPSEDYSAFLDGITFLTKYGQRLGPVFGDDEQMLQSAFASFFREFIATYLNPLTEVFRGESKRDKQVVQVDLPESLRFIYPLQEITANMPRRNSLSCKYLPVIDFFKFKQGKFEARAFLERESGPGVMFIALEEVLRRMYSGVDGCSQSPPGLPELKERPSIRIDTQYAPRRIYVSSPRSLITVLKDLGSIPSTCDSVGPLKFSQLVSREKVLNQAYIPVSDRVRKEWYHI